MLRGLCLITLNKSKDCFYHNFCNTFLFSTVVYFILPQDSALPLVCFFLHTVSFSEIIYFHGSCCYLSSVSTSLSNLHFQLSAPLQPHFALYSITSLSYHHSAWTKLNLSSNLNNQTSKFPDCVSNTFSISGYYISSLGKYFYCSFFLSFSN